MNTWIRGAVRSVGLAGGVLLLGAGTVQSHVSKPAAMDPRQIHGLLRANAPADPARQGLDALPAGVDGPNMIGDDFVDQSPYAGPLPLAALDSLPGLDILPAAGDLTGTGLAGLLDPGGPPGSTGATDLGGLTDIFGVDSLPTTGLPATGLVG